MHLCASGLELRLVLETRKGIFCGCLVFSRFTQKYMYMYMYFTLSFTLFSACEVTAYEVTAYLYIIADEDCRYCIAGNFHVVQILRFLRIDQLPGK